MSVKRRGRVIGHFGLRARRIRRLPIPGGPLGCVRPKDAQVRLPASSDRAVSDRRSLMRLPAVISLALFFGCGHGAAGADPLTTAGIGVANCGKLATDMKPEQGFDNMANVLIYYWVQGYMSAANITTLESDSNYIDLSKFDEKKLLPMIYDFCSQNPDKKPISLIDSVLEKTEKISGKWKKGSIPWAAE
jgi:hypothetical protein